VQRTFQGLVFEHADPVVDKASNTACRRTIGPSAVMVAPSAE